MNPIALIPAADAIPVGWGWFEGLNIATFTLHILMVNVLIGGGAFALYLNSKDGSDPAATAMGRRLPTIFALTVNFGVAPLLFIQVLYGNLFYTGSVLTAALWLSVIALLIGGYYALYLHQRSQEKGGTNGWLLVGLALTILISLLMTNILTLMIRPESWQGFMGQVGAVLNLTDPTIIPRYLHYLFASLAVGGLAVAFVTRYTKGPNADATRTSGLKLFTLATILQMAAGLWWFMALKQSVMLQFMGNSTLGTAVFLVAVFLSLGALAAGATGKLHKAMALTALTVLAMVMLRAVLRSFVLEPTYSPASVAVTGEYSPMVLFLVTLAVGLAVVAYMLKLAFRAE